MAEKPERNALEVYDRLINLLPKVGFKGKISSQYYTDADAFMLLLLNHKLNYEGECDVTLACRLYEAIEKGKVDAAWLFGPNAVALIKIKVAQTPALQKWCPLKNHLQSEAETP